MTHAKVPVHPCEFSPEVIECLRGLIHSDEHIHDPFAGMGRRLGTLCDEIGAEYSGTDIEPWPGADHRVWVGDATEQESYPYWSTFTVATSPVYLNKRLADYADGPLPTTKIKGRRDYGISLGRSLHERNLARRTGRASRADGYWSGHSQAIRWWGHRALVNVDEPISTRWCEMLSIHRFKILDIHKVYTKRYGGLDNAEKRAEHEVVIVAEKLRYLE